MASTHVLAAKRKDRFYFSGKECRSGHVAPRYTNNRQCVKCSLESYKAKRTQTLAHRKAQYKANPEKYRQRVRARALKDPRRYWATAAMYNARRRAAQAKVPFDITLDHLVSLVPTHCPVFGTEFILVGNGGSTPESATLDRKVPDKGYIEGNLIVISRKANAIKNDATSKEVAIVAQWMYEEGL